MTITYQTFRPIYIHKSGTCVNAHWSIYQWVNLSSLLQHQLVLKLSLFNIDGTVWIWDELFKIFHSQCPMQRLQFWTNYNPCPCSLLPHTGAAQPGSKATPVDPMDSIDDANLTDGESVLRLYSCTYDTFTDKRNAMIHHPENSLFNWSSRYRT